MEPFWKKGSRKSKNPIVFNNQFSANFLSKDDGIGEMVSWEPVVYESRELQSGVRFSYTVLSLLEKALRENKGGIGTVGSN